MAFLILKIQVECLVYVNRKAHLGAFLPRADSSHLTAVALRIAELGSDEVLHPEGLAHAAPCE